MDTNTLLIILVVIFLLGGFGSWPGTLVLKDAALTSSEQNCRTLIKATRVDFRQDGGAKMRRQMDFKPDLNSQRRTRC